MHRMLAGLILCLIIVNQCFAQCATGGAVWLNGQNNGQYSDTGLLGGYVTAAAVTSGTMVSGRPLYAEGSSTWKGLNYSSLQVYRAYSSPGSNRTYFKLSQALDSGIFHIRVDNIRGDGFNLESQSVRGYLNGAEVPADFKDPVNGATVSGSTILGGGSTTSASQSSMRVFFHGPVDSIVVRQVSLSDWIIAELQIQCNIILPLRFSRWTAQRNGRSVSLNWYNLTETHIRNYTIEHSTNGLQFSDLASLAAHQQGSYSFRHVDADDGAHYYRIRANYVSGESSLSQVRLVRALHKSGFQFFPNPAQNRLSLSLLTVVAKVVIMNMQGEQVFNKVLSGQATIDISHLPKGMYLIRMESRDQLLISKLLVQ